jgi:1,4-alpha-glucan branching enzyme
MRTLFLLALITVLSVSCAGTIRPSAPVVTASGVRFTLMDRNAHDVALAGSFNDWSISAHRLARKGSGGVWMCSVDLPPGEHTFMYVADGTRWISPPLADYYVDDGFGSRNGAVVVTVKER